MHSSGRILEVEVNGKHTFILAQDPLVDRCGRLAKIIRGTSLLTACHVNALRVAFHDLPGGPEAFELAARFCYSHGRSNISASSFHVTASNVAVLRCIAEYMEMTEEFIPRNLIKETENFLQNMVFWSWNEVLMILRSCEAVLPYAEKTQIVHRCVESLAWKASTINSTCQSPTSSTSPETSSSNNTSNSNNSSGPSKRLSRTWWFEDLTSLSIYLMERIVKAMIANNLDHRILARFLVHYVQSSLPVLGYSISPVQHRNRDEHILQKYTHKVQKELLETVVDLLGHLDHGSASCSALFGLLRMATSLNAGKSCKKNLEKMIGNQLDKASLDDILIPLRPSGSGSLYDVDLVLRLVDRFLSEQDILSDMSFPTVINGSMTVAAGGSFRRAFTKFESSLNKVADLIDKYLVEISADPHLKPFKFKSIAKALPDSARIMHDGLYRALDIYLQAHPTLSESESMELCKVVNYQKLSFEGCKLAAQNARFPARLALQILLLQQSKLRDTIDHCFFKEGLRVSESSRYREMGPQPVLGNNNNQINNVPAVTNVTAEPSLEFGLIIRQNEELKSDIHKMQAKVSELEKLCKRMRSDMSSRSRTRRLLC